MTLQINSTLQGGKYRILSVLGQGGFGITYLAEQTMLGCKVAIKEFFMKEFCNREERTSHVSIGTEGSRETVKRFRVKFLKEARNITNLKHPNIVRIIDVFDENDTSYYVMDYIGGGSLSSKVKRYGALPEDEATSYILQVADALDYIHQRNMNHLDVKPANIVLSDENGAAILIDFGLSKQYDATGEQTSSTPVGVSEGYAPLEQYRPGGVGIFSPQTDIYSLGATFFYLLTGQTPPSATDVNEDGIPVEQLRSKGVSQKVIDVICNSMKSSRKQRLQDVGAFKEMLNSNVYAHEKGEAKRKDSEDTLIVSIQSESLDSRVETNRKTIAVNGVSFKMVRVEGGSFMMGATSEQGDDAYDSEKPAHQVIISSFSIGETEVTQELWEAVMGSNPSNFKGAKRPVEQVSWNDCQTFISKLNTATGKSFRLPTEAEWEFAARGGRHGRGYKYSGSSKIDDVAWYWNNWTYKVATKQSNELGLYDMSGNVYEWCSDWYGSYSRFSPINPKGLSSGQLRVCRGGSWGRSATSCRVSCRGFNFPDDRCSNLGLRLVLSE